MDIASPLKEQRSQVQSFKKAVEASVVSSCLQTIRLDYIMFKSEIFQIIFFHKREQAVRLIHQIKNQTYYWSLNRYSEVFATTGFADKLFILHTAIIDFGMNGLKASLLEEYDYAQTQFDAMQQATDEMLTLIKIHTHLDN